MNVLWKLSNFIMAIFFGLATYVQHNDELAVLWMLVYAIPCLLCCSVAYEHRFIKNKHFQRALYLLLSVYILFSLYLFYCLMVVVIATQDYSLLDHQEGKELFGVLIIQTWLLISIYFLNAQVPFDALMTKTAKLVILSLSMFPLALWLYHGCFGEQKIHSNTTNGTNTTLI